MTVWYDIQDDKYSKRFYAKVESNQESWDRAFASMFEELSNLKCEGLLFNVYLYVEAGIVNFYPCKHDSIKLEEGVLFNFQFIEFLKEYRALSKRRLPDKEFDAAYVDLMIGFAPRIKRRLVTPIKEADMKLVFTDVEFNRLEIPSYQ